MGLFDQSFWPVRLGKRGERTEVRAAVNVRPIEYVAGMIDDGDFGSEQSRGLAYLILSSRKGKPLDAAGAAYIYGCDVDTLAAAHAEHLEESREWGASALQARAAGAEAEAEGCLSEARAWASGANLLRDAYRLCSARNLAAVAWPLHEHVCRYRDAGSRHGHAAHLASERLGLTEAGGDTLTCCEVSCCAEICCGGEHCDCCEYVAGHSQCRVCGQFSTLRATPPEWDTSGVQQDPLVIAAHQHEKLMEEELYAAFDAAVDQWAREVGVRRL